MGRAARKGIQSQEQDGLEPGGARQHWTETHPDRDMWSPGRLAMARTQTQEEYEALYGRGAAATLLVSFLEDPEGHILLRKRGQYIDGEEARQSGDSLPLVRVETSGLHIDSLGMGHVDEDVHAFTFNEEQVATLLRLADEHFPAEKEMPLSDLWSDGTDIFGSNHRAVGAWQYPHVEVLLDETIADMKNGDRLSFDTESHLQVRKKDDQFVLLFNGQETPFDSPEELRERLLVQGQGNRFLFAPRPIRPLDPFAKSENPIDSGDPLVLVGERDQNKLWVNRDGCFVLDTADGQEVLGWSQLQHFVLALRQPADLDRPASELLLQFLRSMQNG